MPYLRFKGFEEGFLRGNSSLIVEEFARAAGVPHDKVKVELLPVIRITSTPLSLEIFMFPRAQRKHDIIAQRLDALLRLFGMRDVHIFFIPLLPQLYYKKGEPLREISWLPGYGTDGG